MFTPDGLPEGISAELEVDREKAEAMGVSFEEINQTLSSASGSNYVNDYTDNGRVQQVIVQPMRLAHADTGPDETVRAQQER